MDLSKQRFQEKSSLQREAIFPHEFMEHLFFLMSACTCTFVLPHECLYMDLCCSSCVHVHGPLLFLVCACTWTFVVPRGCMYMDLCSFSWVHRTFILSSSWVHVHGPLLFLRGVYMHGHLKRKASRKVVLMDRWSLIRLFNVWRTNTRQVLVFSWRCRWCHFNVTHLAQDSVVFSRGGNKSKWTFSEDPPTFFSCRKTAERGQHVINTIMDT